MIRKKIIILIAVFVPILILVGTLIYVAITQKKETPQEPDPTSQAMLPENKMPSFGIERLEKEVGEKKDILKKIQLFIDDQVNFPILSPDGKYIYYYSASDNNLIKYSIENQIKEKLFSKSFECANVVWSPNKTKALITSAESMFVLDLKTGWYKKLSEEITNAIWNPTSDKIAYQYFSELAGKNELDIANLDGSNYKKITPLKGLEHLTEVILMNWSPSGKYIYYVIESSDFSGIPFKRVDLETGKIENLSNWGKMSDMLFPPTEKKYSMKQLTLPLNFNLFLCSI